MHIGNYPLRRQANKFTQDQMNDGGHVLNIKLNPLTSRSYESLGPQSGASQESNENSSLFDEDNQYIVSQMNRNKLNF